MLICHLNVEVISLADLPCVAQLMRARFIGVGRILRPAGNRAINLPQLPYLRLKVGSTLRGFRRRVFPGKQAETLEWAGFVGPFDLRVFQSKP
ncbi:MAG: hypothetical protein L0H58_01530, partial [Corynebacterium casei]|nr:hypothetical protein [Corynebacterium casei]